ncbi:hypothetical protein [Streptomyces sp. ISID311]|uniref:hypothetical protein n=1 Tax=Streptomyces sp. ISID311 TaxID=2601673 RepID=UPI00164BD265|nr:hypothetical protein [Streptomyces sp. ISID311]
MFMLALMAVVLVLLLAAVAVPVSLWGAVPVWGRAFLSMPSWSGRASGAGNFIVRGVF